MEKKRGKRGARALRSRRRRRHTHRMRLKEIEGEMRKEEGRGGADREERLRTREED